METELRIQWGQRAAQVGEELDVLIAEMMGVEKRPFSTDMVAALSIVEWLWKQHWLVTLKWMPEGYYFRAGNDGPEMRHWRTHCDLHYMPIDTEENARRSIVLSPWGYGATMAEAVCRAALTAVYEWFQFNEGGY